MSRCKKRAYLFAAWRDRLCYRHWKESRGWVFDAVQKIFARAMKSHSG